MATLMASPKVQPLKNWVPGENADTAPLAFDAVVVPMILLSRAGDESIENPLAPEFLTFVILNVFRIAFALIETFEEPLLQTFSAVILFT